MKFLVFQHVPHEHPGLIAKYAERKGIQLNIIEFWKPYKIPDYKDFNALVIMGGPMGVYDGKDIFPSKEDEISFIKNALGKIPIMGFCLGSQLLAYVLGAQVYPNVINGKRIKEIGYYNVELSKDGLTDQIFRNFKSPIKVLQWHGDAFDLPDGSILLATSVDCKNQAFRYRNKTYGMLFHNEFTPEMVKQLIEIDKGWIHKDFSFNEEKVKKEAAEYKSLMEEQCNKLFDNFTSLV